ncbi:MAG TPA: SRPBCC domain-containing protein [Polyangiaceae bacterium]
MKTTSLTLKRVLPADVARVFQAWSSAEAMSRWFVVDPQWTAKATNDFRVGGRYRVEMRRQDGTIFVAFGEYLEIVPPERMVFTWSSAVPAVQRSVVTLELRAVGHHTELTLTHRLLPDTDEGRAHTIGWEGSLSNLAGYLTATEQPS